MFLSALNVILKTTRLYQIMPKRPKRKIRAKVPKSSTTSTPAKKVKLSVVPNLNFSTTMPCNSKIHVLNNPVKSLNDKKDYKVIRLENGLTACLISDMSDCASKSILATQDDSDTESDSCPEESGESEEDEESEHEEEARCSEAEDEEAQTMTRLHGKQEGEEKLAAASLTIGVGSFSDPESIQGMAHFLEHMVFMGSEKYPQENDFDAFLKKRGGSDNASTDCETTTFYFECLEKHLFRALDKFAQFFISPLMKRETMTREREAIESEFQMALPSDSYRKEQLLASLSQPNSPVNKFLWGNLITLRDNVEDDKLYNLVHEFRKRHYSAHRMTLAIQARLPLKELESYVIECFNNVPTNGLPADSFHDWASSICDTDAFHRIYYVKPVKDVCQVDLTWCLPSLLKMYKSKPHQYVSWLIGHEGKGSLYSYLRNKMWALSISTGNGETGIEHNSIYALFTITLVLTKEGLTHIYEVIEAVFSYLNLLKEVGPQERIYNEIKTVEDTSFRFQDEEDAVDFVETLSEAMQYYPPEDYITGDDIYFEYNPEAITMVLNKLNPRNMNVMILSSTLPEEIQYDKTEKWFSTNYTDREIANEWLEGWTNVKPYSNFSLPETNRFLTTNFSLQYPCTIPPYPEKLLNSDLIELWYKPDNKFKQPVAFMNYYLVSPMAQESAINACMVDLFIGILLIQIAEEVYPAHVAELGVYVSVGDCGVVVKVDGYNEKLPLLLELLFTYIKNVPLAVDEDLFNAIKDKQTKSYYNTFIKPSKLARFLRLSMLMNVFWSPLAKYHAISNITLAEFKSFTDKFLRKFHIQGLIQGNMTKDVALTTTNNIINILGCEPVPASAIPNVRVTQVPVGKHCCKVLSYNNDDVNSIITNYYQFGPGSLKSLVLIEILMLLMEEPLFDVLRTKEQLGYHIYCTVCDTFGILGFSITVNAQATKSTTEHVNERMEAFIKKLVKNIKKMPDKKINKIKMDLIKVKQLVDIHLKDEVSRNWTEILHQDFMFDRIPREIIAIDSLKVSEIRKALEVYSLDEKHTRKLSIQVGGHNTTNNTIMGEADIADYAIKYVTEDNNKPIDHNHISNIFEFKQGLHLFPGHRILH